MHHRWLFLAAAIAGCGDGSRAGTPAVETRRPPMDEGTDRGEANDLGDGSGGAVGNFPRCTRSSGCERGLCVPENDSSGFCAQPCGTVEEVEGIRTGPCLRAEQCAFINKGLGICASPCASDSDCSQSPTRLFCQVSKNAPGRFCLPSLKGSSDPESAEN